MSTKLAESKRDANTFRERSRGQDMARRCSLIPQAPILGYPPWTLCIAPHIKDW